MKMTLICICRTTPINYGRTQFHKRGSHLDAFWNRATRELGNSLLPSFFWNKSSYVWDSFSLSKGHYFKDYFFQRATTFLGQKWVLGDSLFFQNFLLAWVFAELLRADRSCSLVCIQYRRQGQWSRKKYFPNSELHAVLYQLSYQDIWELVT